MHCAEEADRRARRARELEFVGDHRCPEEAVGLQVPSLTAQQFPFTQATDAQAGLPVAPPPSLAAAEREPVEWILVASPELLAGARSREGTEASCPFCGRRGRIGRVVSLAEWKRWLRRGLEPP